MKPLRSIFLFLWACFLMSCQTTQTKKHSENEGWTRPSSHEFRGAWVYDPRRFDPEEVVKDLKKAGFNAVFVRLSSAGAAFYPSEVLPQAPDTTRDYAQAYADAGKKYQIEVYGWHVCFMMHYAPLSQINKTIKGGEVMRDAKGRVLRPTYRVPVRTPALYSNRLLERQAIVELITKYPLHGVQLDYIRYFSPNVDFSATSRAAFEKVRHVKIKKWPSDVISGPMKNQYHQWQTEVITSVVKDISYSVKAANPQAKVSAAVWYNPEVGVSNYAQDWIQWVKEGYLDFVVPMNYTPDNNHLRSWIENQKELVGGKIPLYAGLGSYMLNRPKQLNQQIEICRELGLPGYVLFNYDERLKLHFLPEIAN